MPKLTPEQLSEKVCWNLPYNAYQKTGELAALLHLIQKHKPKTILEIGTHFGGATYCMQQMCPEAKIICVDNNILDESFDTGEQLAKLGVKCTFIDGDSQIKETLDKVKQVVKSVDFVFIDADHTAGGVRADWGLYSTLVPKGGIVALHDISPEVKEHGVAPLWEEIKAEYKTEELWEEPYRWGGIGIVYM
jgi:predicted O-methyltransferase YrrM